MENHDSAGSQDITWLLDELQDDDPQKKLHAVEFAGMQKISQAVPDMIKLAESIIDPYQPQERQLLESTIDALGEIGDPQAVSYLVKSLDNVFYSVQTAALNALGKMGAEDALDHVWNILNKEAYPEFVKEAAIDTLGGIANKTAETYLQQLTENPNLPPTLKDKAFKTLNYKHGYW